LVTGLNDTMMLSELTMGDPWQLMPVNMHFITSPVFNEVAK